MKGSIFIAIFTLLLISVTSHAQPALSHRSPAHSQSVIAGSSTATPSFTSATTLPPFSTGTPAWDADSLGNIRAIVEVTTTGKYARAIIPWRRSDLHPETKRILIQDARTGALVENTRIAVLTNESGEIWFEPTSGKGTYYIYYMPYRNEGRSNYPKGVYLSALQSVHTAWQESAATTTTAAPAHLKTIQSIDSFNSPYPMEVIATANETAAIIKSSGRKDYLVFPEDRRYPVRMKNYLPSRWTAHPYHNSFDGTAGKGEQYSYQLAVYTLDSLSNVRVDFSDLRNEKGAIIPASKISCLNTDGIDYTGKPFSHTVNISAGQVQPLWCLLDIPVAIEAGQYKGFATLYAAGAAPTRIAIRLLIKDTTLADGGISRPWDQTRLHWLNSTLKQDNTVIAPYTPITVQSLNSKNTQPPSSTISSGTTLSASGTALSSSTGSYSNISPADTPYAISLLGRRILLGSDGLPQQIQTFFTPEMTGYSDTANLLLNAPIHFECTDAAHTSLPFTTGNTIRFTQQEPGTVEWSASSNSPSLQMDVTGRLEFDGFMQYQVKVIALRDAALDDISMVIPFKKEMARYMMGLGQKGGPCPTAFNWKWQVATKNQDGAWIGAVNAGLQFSLRDEKYSRPLNTNFYLQKPLLLPTSWGNDNKGGIDLETKDGSLNVRNFSGSRSMKKGDTLFYNITFLITPFHPINTDFQWANRFYHRYNDIDSIKSTGATVVNIHHATPINPWINYPFLEWKKMKDYIDEAHAKGLKVKIYNTVRELSDRAYELFPMRSLGHEIYSPGKGGGFSWLQEHVKEDYIAAWFVPEIKDAALINSGMNRWHNYYVEGMNWLVQNVGIDGIYLDDVAFDRVTMKRIKRVLTSDGHPGIIDLHSANQYNKSDGFNNSANLYMEHFPYLNRLWFGEYFDYEKNDPAFFLTEVSGIPFGLMGEMLQGGGNPWRGMIYGMTNRMPWSDNADPRAIWKLWDDFGISGSAMLGYWSGHCPVTTSDKQILATVYKKEKAALVSIASWNPADTTIKLSVDWKSLGIDPARAVITAPEVTNFQSAASFNPDSMIPVQKGKGWLLIIREK